CPLGAFYGLFSKVSVMRLELDKSACTNCKACEKKCDMQVEITKNINSAECIQCGKCMDVCPNGAIKRVFGLK
ncbi:MAG: 4Fe-4S binding protein, partial [Lachnospiraceae bacterium]|nr:4Fe-4S binding protein [Lachnospiraceae bacterium]